MTHPLNEMQISIKPIKKDCNGIVMKICEQTYTAIDQNMNAIHKNQIYYIHLKGKKKDVYRRML